MKIGTLFSGACDSFATAAQDLGMEVVYNCENDKWRRSVLKRRFPDAVQFDDILTLTNPPYTDIIAVSSPCQDFSLANANGKGIDGEKSKLLINAIEIIGEVRPRYFVLENSTNIINRGFERVLAQISKIGYDAEWICLRANMFGLPHERERIFIVGYPTDTDQIGRYGLLQGQIGMYNLLAKTSSNKNVTPGVDSEYQQIAAAKNYTQDDGLQPDNLPTGVRQRDINKHISAFGDAIALPCAKYILTIFNNQSF